MDTSKLNKDEKVQLIKALEARQENKRFNRRDEFFPDTGPLRRELYTRHLEFFKSGEEYKERAFIAGNRTGKTIAGAYEATCHLTGDYPDWWVGKRFQDPIEAWVVGVTNEQTRDVLQKELLGRKSAMGTGMIPKHKILRTTHRSLPPDSVADAYIQHSSGGQSVVSFKSAIQGRETFQGTAKHMVWCDEEIPEDIYNECLLRTMTCKGIMMLTFTPLQNLTNLVLSFLPGGKIPAYGRVPGS